MDQFFSVFGWTCAAIFPVYLYIFFFALSQDKKAQKEKEEKRAHKKEKKRLKELAAS